MRRPQDRREGRAARPERAGGSREPHGYTAEDHGGVGEGEEGYRAEDYPGENPLRNESEREGAHRATHARTWPRLRCEGRHVVGEGPRQDRRICEEIAGRIARAEPDLERVVVHVHEGEVRIEGEVDTLADRQVLEGIVGTVAGVRAVESRLATREG